MNVKKSKKRIAAGFALFLGFMWMCTLVSKSIYTTKLPVVSTSILEEKYVEHKVEAEGIVIEGGKRAVTAPLGLRVKALTAHTGDRVEKGDVLFQIDLEDLEEIIKKKQTEIDKLNLQVNAILENQELAKQKKEIDEARAREDYDTTARQKDTDIGRAADVYARTMEEIEDLEGTLNEQEQRQLSDALQSAAYGEADAKRERDKVMKGIQRNIEDILFPKEADATLSITRTEIAQKKEDLSVYQDVFNCQGNITASVAGMVTDIFVDAGDRIFDGAAMMMTDERLPCQFKVTLDKEQKKYIGIGDEISVKLEGSGWELEAVIDYFSESQILPGGYETFVNLPEDMGFPGLSGTLTHSERGEKYQSCISPQAVYTDNKNRNYIYVLKEREGVLGSEYYAEEVNIKILDQNDDWAAIESAAIDGETQIIISSDREFAKGDVVRWLE